MDESVRAGATILLECGHEQDGCQAWRIVLLALAAPASAQNARYLVEALRLI